VWIVKRLLSFEIPKYIKGLRGNLSVGAFIAAHGLKVSRQTVYVWERGDDVPTPENLKKLGIRVVYEVKG